VVELGGAEERRTLAFRDYLRDHPGTARRYAGLELDLARCFAGADAGSREACARAKSEFVEEIFTLAKEDAHGNRD
jgi:GrpB-like predicted nucleotidyltransferase (UPF0157 family)